MNQQMYQGTVNFLIFILLNFCMVTKAGEAPDLYKNQLHFGYGINYKYNGKLYHNLDRVWVVHRVVIPKLEDLEKLPDFPDELDCTPHPQRAFMGKSLFRKVLAQRLCQLAAPQLESLRQQAHYLKGRVMNLVKDDLYHALHSLHPVSHFEYKRKHKRVLTPTPGSLLANESLTNYTLTSDIPNEDIPRNRSKRIIGAIASAALPAIGKLATLAVEELGAYLQRKRNKALEVALQEMDKKMGISMNEMENLM